MSRGGEVSQTKVRAEIIVSPLGKNHGVRKNFWGTYVRRLDWRVTACGMIADRGWSQTLRFGEVECRTCLRVLERLR